MSSCKTSSYFENIERINYQLNLDKDYDSILKKYRKDRKKSLRKAVEAKLDYQDFNTIDALIKLYKEVFSHINTSDKYFTIIKNLMTFSLENNKGFIRNIYVDKKLICSGFFARDKSRIYYLFAASNTQGRKFGATTFLINSVIKEYSNSNFIFDFEGSTIPNVANFYKSFGSEETVYFNLKTNVFKRIFL